MLAIKARFQKTARNTRHNLGGLRLHGIPILILGAALAIGYTVQQVRDSNWRLERHQQLDDVAHIHAILLQRQLAKYTVAAHLLGHQLRENNGELANFEAYADRLIAEIGGITNLQLAPGGVISRIHPLPGHEAALGYDIVTNQYLRGGSMKAIESRTLTVIGPLNLIQGGVGIFGRYPVFLPDGRGGDVFWGLASVLIMLDDFLASTQLGLLTEQGYRYRLWRMAPETGEKTVFAGELEGKLAAPVTTATVSLPNEAWFLDLAFAAPQSHSPGYFIGLALSGLIGAGLAWIAYLYLRLPERLRHQVERQTRQLEAIAFYDELTGLPNRKLFIDRLTQAIHRQHRGGQAFALIYVDLDMFKNVNDTLGHSVGDRLLVAIANRLTDCIRKSDTAARIGGDEFTVLLMDIQPPANVAQLANNLLAVLGAPIEIDNHTIQCTASIGVTLCPDDGEDPEQLLNNGDLAMYRAKQLGKNNVQFFSGAMHDEAERRRVLYDRVVAALAEEALFLVYQPVVSLTTGKVVSVEALLRWRRDGGTVALPAEFIPAIADTNLITQVGQYVIRHAVRDIGAMNRDRRGDPIGLSVNLSSREFNHPDFFEAVRNALGRYSLSPALLTLEIPEAAFSERLTGTRTGLETLGQAGVGLSIDHFGTGYASLRDLRHPVLAVKIDISLVAGINTDEDTFKLSSAAIAMSHLLGIRVVANGVETPAQLETLQGLGCDMAQGYLFGGPVAPGELPALIRRIEDSDLDNQQAGSLV